MKNFLFFCLIFSIFSHNILLAQNTKRANIWFFGYNAGINFNTSPPSPISDGAVSTWEGCATYCDTSGNIIIYTDGSTIWNKKHQIIPNAVNLGGNNSASQSGIIVPKPNSNNILYVFSVDQLGFGGIHYSELDIDANNGNGKLISSKNLLLPISAEKLTVIPHCNNSDWWVVSHGVQSNKFYSWKVTENGIITTPTESSVGEVHDTYTGAIGYLKASLSGNKIALANYGEGFYEILDFDRSNGKFSNPILLKDQLFDHAYGVEFSPNEAFLYVSKTESDATIYQFDIRNGKTSAEIMKTKKVVGTGDSYFGALQLAPDGRIFITKDKSNYLSIINNPDSIGQKCNFKEDAFDLINKKCGIGLPNIIPSFSYIKKKNVLSIEKLGCDIKIVCHSFSTTPLVYQWFLNGKEVVGANDSVLQVSASGIYLCKFSSNNLCNNLVTTSNEIFINFENIKIHNINITNESCKLNDGMISFDLEQINSPFSFNWSNGSNTQNQNNLSKGKYEVTITNSLGCSQTYIFNIEKPTFPKIKYKTFKSICGNNNGKIIFEKNNSNLEVSFDNITFNNILILDKLKAGNYNLFLRSNSCDTSFSISVVDSTIIDKKMLFEAINPICGKGNGMISIINSSEFETFSIDEVNYSSNNIFSELSKGSYTIFAKSAGCLFSIDVKLTEQQLNFTFDYEVKNSVCGENNGKIIIKHLSGGTPPYKYSTDFINFQSDSIFQHLSVGKYYLYFTDSNNCSSNNSHYYDIKENCDCTAIFSPNIFSPNDDSINDSYKIFFSDSVKEISKLEIFNKWGDIVYANEHLSKYTSNENWWNGKMEIQKYADEKSSTNQNIYTWIAKIVFNTNETKTCFGEITLLKK